MLEITTNPKILIYGIPIYLGLLVVEMFLSFKHEKHLYRFKDSLASAWMGLGSIILGLGAKTYSIIMFVAVFEVLRSVRMDLFGYESLGWGVGIWALCFILDDFTFYWHHRFSHTIRCLWAAHIVHHSSEHYNLSVGLRNGWVTIYYKPIWWLWMIAVGFHPLMVVTTMAINSIYQFGLHTKALPSLGILEKILNTPWVHQVHHACDLEYLDKNHGGMLIIWDKIFGTFRDNKGEVNPTFGVLSGPNSYNPFIIFSHEYRNIFNDVRKSKNLKDAFMYIFGPPGWSPDNSTRTVRQLMRELKAKGEVDDPYLRKRFNSGPIKPLAELAAEAGTNGNEKARNEELPVA